MTDVIVLRCFSQTSQSSSSSSSPVAARGARVTGASEGLGPSYSATSGIKDRREKLEAFEAVISSMTPEVENWGAGRTIVTTIKTTFVKTQARIVMSIICNTIRLSPDIVVSRREVREPYLAGPRQPIELGVARRLVLHTDK